MPQRRAVVPIKATPNQRTRVFAISPQSLLNMLIHYTEDRGGDRVPVDAELREFQQSVKLAGMFKLVVRSNRWECPVLVDGSLAPLDFRFTGSKVLTLGRKGQEETLDTARETRKR